jgi:hypothetical protein
VGQWIVELETENKTVGTIMNYILIAVVVIFLFGVIQYCFQKQTNPVRARLNFNAFILSAATLQFIGEAIDYLVHLHSATTRTPSAILLVVIALLLSNRSQLKNRLGEKDKLS